MINLMIFWISCSLLAAFIGSQKGEGLVSFVLGIVFGPIGLLIAISGKGNRRTCQYCRELINNQAVICPYCQKTIEKGY